MMDPNEALARARSALAGFDPDGEGPSLGEIEELGEMFRALDGWLSKGGALPDAWDHNRCPRCAESFDVCSDCHGPCMGA